MIIVFEGDRKTGKTTTATTLKYIIRNKSVFYMHSRNLFKYDFKNYEEVVFGNMLACIDNARSIEASLDGECLILFDRLHLSEAVFGKELRGYENKYVSVIDEELAKLNAKGILFTSETNTKRSKEVNRNEKFIMEMNKSKIKWGVVNLDEENGFPSMNKLRFIINFCYGGLIV